jgi:hypothetical protein
MALRRFFGRARERWPLVVPSVLAAVCMAAMAQPASAATERIRITFEMSPDRISVPGGGGAAAVIYDAANNYVGCHVVLEGPSTCSANGIANSRATVNGTTITFEDGLVPSTRCFRVNANDSLHDSYSDTPLSVRASFVHPDGTRTDVGPFDLQNKSITYLGSTPVEPGVVPGGPQPDPASHCRNSAPTGNRPPVAKVDTARTAGRRPIYVPVLRNDTDPDGDSIRVRGAGKARLGKVWCAPDSCTYQPRRGFKGIDSFQYTIVDEHGAADTTRVKIRLLPGKQPSTHKKRRLGKKAWPAFYRCWAKTRDCWVLIGTAGALALHNDGWGKRIVTDNNAWGACTQFNIIPLPPQECAANIMKQYAQAVFEAIWNWTIVQHAAGFYEVPLQGLIYRHPPKCLAIHYVRKRGTYDEFGKPDLHTTYSLVPPGWYINWRINLSELEVPLRCGSDGKVYVDSGPIIKL